MSLFEKFKFINDTSQRNSVTSKCHRLDIFKIIVNIPVKAEFICVICNKILKNACSSPCGCRYCEICIKNYLIDQDKCPRKIGDCQEQILNFKKDIVVDHVANKLIFSTQVECPEKFCEFKSELKNMMDHIKSHKEECPFFEIGCSKPRKDIKTIASHMNEDNYTHSKLLMETIQNLKNEVSSFKEDSAKKESSINALENQIATLQIENLVLSQAVELLQEKQNKITLNQIKILTEKLKRKQEIIDELQSEIATADQNIKSNLEPIKIMQDSVGSQLDFDIKKIKKIDLRSGYYYQFIGPLEENEVYRDYEYFSYYNTDEHFMFWSAFKWKIENYNEKVEDAREKGVTEIYSDPFYSHKGGYKMILVAKPSYSTGKGCYLSLFFCILKGEYDNKLEWPMKRPIALCLGNLNSTYYETKYQYSYDTIEEKHRYVFDKPTGEIYYAFGMFEFYHINRIFNNLKLYQNKSLTLTCLVKNS